MKYYDTIIVGAGLAGCVLGYLLLNNNRDVIIIENKDLNKKNKLCGGIVTVKSYRLLNKIYGDKIKDWNLMSLIVLKLKIREL